MTPAFVSLDGIDGTGKTTQCRLLAEWLGAAGIGCVPCVDPGGTALGAELRAILLHAKSALALRAEALLFMASRAQLIAEIIGPALRAGQVVLSDRYLTATLAYQGYAGGLPVEELRALGHFAAGHVLPGRVFILDFPLEAALARRGLSRDRIEGRPDDFQREVRAGFLREAALFPATHRLIDASPAIDEVQRALRRGVKEYLCEIGHPGHGDLAP